MYMTRPDDIYLFIIYNLFIISTLSTSPRQPCGTRPSSRRSTAPLCREHRLDAADQLRSPTRGALETPPVHAAPPCLVCGRRSGRMRWSACGRATLSRSRPRNGTARLDAPTSTRQHIGRVGAVGACSSLGCYA